jgi:hypothetical protein
MTTLNGLKKKLQTYKGLLRRTKYTTPDVRIIRRMTTMGITIADVLVPVPGTRAFFT